MGRAPYDKRGTSKWVLPFDSDGWQRPDGSHQWDVVETLLCLRKEVIPFNVFSPPSSDCVTRHDCDMLLILCNEKKYEALRVYHAIAIA